MAALVLGCGALCFNRYSTKCCLSQSNSKIMHTPLTVPQTNYSIKDRQLKKRSQKAQEFEKMRLANEKRIQRLSHEGVLELPRIRTHPHIPGSTPPPSYHGSIQSLQVSGSEDATHQCHMVDAEDHGLMVNPVKSKKAVTITAPCQGSVAEEFVIDGNYVNFRRLSRLPPTRLGEIDTYGGLLRFCRMFVH